MDPFHRHKLKQMKHDIASNKKFFLKRQCTSPRVKEKEEIKSGQFIPYVNERNHMGKLIKEEPIEKSLQKKKLTKRGLNRIESSS